MIPRHGLSPDRDDDKDVGRRKAVPEKDWDQTFSDNLVEGMGGDHMASPKAVQNFSGMCPCGHSSLQHGVGMHGSSQGGHCEVKGCCCSGYGNKPGQGYSWALGSKI